VLQHSFLESGWADADLQTPETAGENLEVASNLATDQLPDVKLGLRRLLRATGLSEPADLAGWMEEC
jgi:hypothetical protein